MRNPKRTHEGYLLVDHRAGPGLPREMTDPLGLAPMVGGSVMESATITCSHCQKLVVLNPDRQRSRGYCPKCDHYICDECEIERVASGYACMPFVQIGDEALEAAEKGRLPPALPFVLPRKVI